MYCTGKRIVTKLPAVFYVLYVLYVKTYKNKTLYFTYIHYYTV